MSEQTKKPTQGERPTAKKGDVSRMKVLLDGGKPEEKPLAKRSKPSVSSAKARVDIPGELKAEREEKKPDPPAKKQSPTPKKDDKPKEVGKPASQPESSPAKPAQAKKPKPPAKKKPIPRPKVVPPKIGSRRGYRPTLALRLQVPVFLVACVVCAFALLFSFRKEVGPVGRYVASALAPGPVELTIEAGMSASSVSLLLSERGVVDDDQALLQYFIKNNLTTSLRSGTLVMERGMDHEAIGTLLTAKAGEVVIGVSPSFTLAAIDRYLANRGYADKGEFLKAAKNLESEYSLSFAEGWLLSGEYLLAKEEVASSLAEAMFLAMLEAVQPHLHSEQVTLWGLEQTLIVASMIQAETQNAEEMPLIASVIYNRLRAGQPLGIDATTRYELDDWENPIPKKALETKTPYNTRRKVGLPPSGICCPSKAALEAALFPLDSPYFYYLHGLDKRLYPAVTYDEHKENIKVYR
ncbi:MAG: endolytic transglycosylase MltG [Sphaerochaeta sp.]|nr:endolytic transglycosylase MltG [Sphaerochaeta sp.]